MASRTKASRPLGPWDFIDHKGKRRTNKATILQAEAEKIRRAKIESSARRTGKKVFIKLTPMTRLNLNPLLQQYFIKMDGRIQGSVGRGHAKINDKHGAHTYSMALSELERIENKFFKEGRFDTYKEGVIFQLQEELRLYVMGKQFTDDAIKFFDSLKEPVHIDYAMYFSRVGALIKNGYEIAPPTLEILHKIGLRKGSSPRETINFIKLNPMLEQLKILFIFTKKSRI